MSNFRSNIPGPFAPTRQQRPPPTQFSSTLISSSQTTNSSTTINSAAFQDQLIRSLNLNPNKRQKQPRRRKKTSNTAQPTTNSSNTNNNWICEPCTFSNNSSSLQCAACSSPKPRTLQTNMPQAFHNPTLAQMRGLAPKPSPKLTIDEWSNLEYEAIKRGDAGSTCAICHDPFGEDEQVILSCSHTFHRGCIASFEKFLRTKERTCPICRHASYQKKITSIGSFIKRQDSCTLIQKTIRRWRVKINFKTLLRAHYKSNDDTVNVGRKRDFYAGEISIVSDQIAAQVQASEDTIDSLFAEFDRNLTMSREVFNPELAAANAATRESNDLLRTKASSKDAKNENSNGLIKIKAWINILKRAEERGACECPICLSSYEENTSTDKAILSCSHTLHIKCVDAFEKFNIYEINLCPVCRAGPYQKKLVSDLQYYRANSENMNLNAI